MNTYKSFFVINSNSELLFKESFEKKKYKTYFSLLKILNYFTKYYNI